MNSVYRLRLNDTQYWCDSCCNVIRLDRFRFGTFLNSRHLVLILAIDIVEVDTIVDDNGFELCERPVHPVAHHGIGRERYLLTTFNHNALTRMDVHTLAGTDARHLERAQSFYLQLLLVTQGIVHHLNHSSQEALRLPLADVMLCGNGSC